MPEYVQGKAPRVDRKFSSMTDHRIKPIGISQVLSEPNVLLSKTHPHMTADDSDPTTTWSFDLKNIKLNKCLNTVMHLTIGNIQDDTGTGTQAQTINVVSLPLPEFPGQKLTLCLKELLSGQADSIVITTEILDAAFGAVPSTSPSFLAAKSLDNDTTVTTVTLDTENDFVVLYGGIGFWAVETSSKVGSPPEM